MKTWLKRLYYRWVYRNIGVTIGKEVILNKHNSFEGNNAVGNNAEVATAKVGRGTYISDNSTIRKTIIGRFCSIGSNVQTGLGLHPSDTFVSTHPAFFSTQKQAGFSFVGHNTFKEHIFVDTAQKYVVAIGNDVWIGSNVLIMDGVKVGDGAIIAAGAIVTKDVEPYTIVGGIPAKFMRLRFTPQQIDKLLKLKWWDWSFDKIKERSAEFANIESFADNAL
jgi:acetyltransferase-like isoleucine patch superfamily enzyme